MARETAVTISIIEDDQIIREGYRSLLQVCEDFEIAGLFGSYEEAALSFPLLKPDVVLLDIELPGIKGTEAILKIKKQLPAVKIIMLTAHEHPELLFEALTNGAAGYLSKRMPAARLIDSIQDIIQWGGSFSPSIARLIAQAFQKSSDSPLTKRETEVLQLIADGKTRSLVAKQLFIDMETVKTHIKNIYLKLDVHTRSEAIRMAREQRFIR